MTIKEQIETQGYAIQGGLLGLGRATQDLEEDTWITAHRSRAGVRHALSLESVRRIAHSESMLQLARGVLGPQAFPFRATLFDKSAASNWLVVWHQDTALPLQHRRDVPGWGPWSTKDGVAYAHAPANVLSQVLALRFHLDDSSKQNGPLRVLPGTHTRGLLSDDEVHELSRLIAPVECLVPKGGVLAMFPLLVHASSKSRSDEPRRVLHIEYAASEAITSPLELAVV